MLIIDLLLELLNERKTWHSIDGIADKASLSEPEVLDIISFLARYKFIVLDENGQKVKITEMIHEFLTEIMQAERKNSIQGVKRASPSLFLNLL